ncbi:MAG TPA: hypothetical protein VL495_06625 [Edaphobacter sp.]|nr:hypothetical protein [Edaphobacter sp.]
MPATAMQSLSGASVPRKMRLDKCAFLVSVNRFREADIGGLVRYDGRQQRIHFEERLLCSA